MLTVFTSFADWLVYALLGLAPWSRAGEALHFFAEDVVKIFALLAVIVFVIGLLRTSLTPEALRGLLAGRRRGVGYLLAGVLGVVTPFCSCSAIPLFIGLLEASVPMGVTMTFLVTSPMVNEVAVVMLAVLLGWKVTALYLATGLAVGILGGVLADRFRLERFVEDYVWKIRMGQVARIAVDKSIRGRLRFGVQQVGEIFRRVWLAVLFGVGAGAALHGYVPQDFFIQYAGPDNPLAVPMAVLIGIPLYSNASGMIPIVEALLTKGVPIGTVLALMMSTTAISLPELLILRKVLRIPMLVLFASFLGLAFVGVGFLFNALL